MRGWKYLAALSIPAVCIWSLLQTDGLSFLAVVYAFVLLPLLELIIGTDSQNLNQAQKEVVSKDRWYDVLLYVLVPLQWATVVLYLIQMQQPELSTATWIGRTTALGMMCGVIGINVGHELGHRTTRWEQGLAKLLLLSSQYTHFFIDHNRGHHKHVATPEDPTTARLGEPVYLFWLRAIPGAYGSAWRIQNQDRKRKGYRFWSFKNEMLWYAVAQIGVLVAAYFFAGGKAALGLAFAAAWGILLLETVNYIEHYGLRRNKVSAFRYESVRPVHSWNSDHIAGRLVLFELTRHSDHHYLPHKKYPLLDSIEEAPQLPAGYPGMMVLALIPPLWFAVMNHRVQATKENFKA